MKKNLLIFALLFVATSSFAFSGNELLQHLSSEDPELRALGIGYVMGTADTLYALADKPDYCGPYQITEEQIMLIVKSHLESWQKSSNPKILRTPASFFVLKAFPCKK